MVSLASVALFRLEVLRIYFISNGEELNRVVLGPMTNAPIDCFRKYFLRPL